MHPTLPRRNRGLSQLELLLVLAILGILGVLAVGELKTLSRRTKTEEAVRGLADMFNGVAAYFNEFKNESVAFPDEDACPWRGAIDAAA